MSCDAGGRQSHQCLPSPKAFSVQSRVCRQRGAEVTDVM
jgi:hypothetical protein